MMDASYSIDPHHEFVTYVNIPECLESPKESSNKSSLGISAFHQRMRLEYAQRKGDFPGTLRSIFFGGAGVSTIPSALFKELLSILRWESGIECTVQLKAPQITADMLHQLKVSGVSRVSISPGSEPTLLDVAERSRIFEQYIHGLNAVRMAQFQSWSADWVFGYHGQTLEEACKDLDGLLETKPPHVTLHELAPHRPPFNETSDAYNEEEEALRISILREGTQRLLAAGLQVLEIANYGRRGHGSIQNLAYWTDTPYLGLGPGAHGYRPDRSRYWNCSDPQAYLTQRDPTDTEEKPHLKGQAADYILASIRCIGGVDLSYLSHTCGHILDPNKVLTLVNSEHVKLKNNRLSLTTHGMCIADTISATLSQSLSPFQSTKDVPK